jgi:predicted HTH transcriptional regulator
MRLTEKQEQHLRGIFVQLCNQPANVVESEMLEVKNWCSNEKQLGEKAADSSACLANHKGGVVLLGIEDNESQSKFSPCHYRNVNEEWIAQRIHDGTVPPVDIMVRDVSDLLRDTAGSWDANCFAVFVEKTRHVGGHQTASGVSRIRSGRECKPNYIAATDDRTRAQVHSANLSFLSEQSISWGIQQHQKKFGLSGRKWESQVEFLASIGVIKLPDGSAVEYSDPDFLLASILLFGTDEALQKTVPGLETILITPAGEQRIASNIVESFRRLCGPRNGQLVTQYPQIPCACIKEALINCYIHRDYRINSPVVIQQINNQLEFESPGALCSGISPESLLYCTPVYRNFLLAEGSRYLGLCDKIGRGIDAIMEGVLQEGLSFPHFECGDQNFSVRFPLEGSREFQEFLRRRSQFLNRLDEIIVLRFLFERDQASFQEISTVMQRSPRFTHNVLAEMKQKLMIAPSSSLNLEWSLCPNVRSDIIDIFNEDQYTFEFDKLFGE